MTKKIPVEELGVFPAPGMGLPSSFRFSYDNKRLLYLYGEGGGTQQLYSLDLETGVSRVLIKPPDGGTKEENLSPEEELERQRQRMLATGITRYQRAAQSDRLLLPIAGNLYIFDGEIPEQIYDGSGQPTMISPTLSSDGRKVAFVRDAEVYVLDIESRALNQVTTGAREHGMTNGLADFNTQEEFHRLEGFWWSPDAAHIAFTEVDERHIPLYRIMHQGKDYTGDGAQEGHRYPFAGEANALVRLGIVPADGQGETRWMNTTYDEEVYIVRVFWWKDGRLGALILNRPQSWIELVTFDTATGERKTVLRDENEIWINLQTNHIFRLDDGTFIWASERGGYNHLYHYAADGTLITQLTGGEWVVDAVQSVDVKKGMVYFSANREDPGEVSLYRVPLAGGEIERITTEAGSHQATISGDFRYFVDVFSNAAQPPAAHICSLVDAASVHPVPLASDPRIEQFELVPPEFVTLNNRNGTTLYGSLYRPPESFGKGPFPTIIYVYGGPGPQLVQNMWGVTASMRSQYLRQQGFLVFTVDSRGSARRGLEFEGAIKHRMGTIEVEDQVDAVRWLVEQGLTDPDRVGVFGWSYGGYMTLMCLTKAPDVFKMGVSGAPVSAWDGYDTGYTERYMSTPQQNPEGYASGTVLNYVENLRGKLLLVHGMLDENVHFRHTARLINALTRSGKDYDLLVFPDERHMPRNPKDRTYLWARIMGYFEQHL